MKMKMEMISWEDYYGLIQKVALEVEEKYSNYRILAISRGGLIPATIISHRINQIIDVLRVFSYNNERRQQDVQIVPFVGWDGDVPTKILIVDDLIDSGNTLFNVYKYIVGKITNADMNLHDVSIKSVVLIDKCESIITPDFSAMQTDESTWITFPYEMR